MKTSKHRRKQKTQRKKPVREEPPWRQLVQAVFDSSKTGELSLPELYGALELTEKARANPTFQATIRRTVQQMESLQPAGTRGVWKLKPR
jgi:hypothetical protein